MTEPPAVSVLAFDWNGTVVDDTERACTATNRVLTGYGFPTLTIADFRERFTLPMRDFFTSMGVPEELATAAEQRWNEEMTSEPAPLSRGALDILHAAELRRVPVVVVSAAAPRAVLRDARDLGIDHLLSDVVGSVVDKVAPLTRLVSAASGRVVYVGDVEYDIRSAITAGAYPVGFGRGYRPAAALADSGAEIVVWNLATLALFLSPHVTGTGHGGTRSA